MSRSYYEWIEAKRQWWNKQAGAIASIPYPSESITYPVVYKRESTNPYWERRRSDAADLIPDSLNFNFQLEDIENFIRTAADFERAKEDDFLAKFYKVSGTAFQNESRTDKFNILFQSRDLYNEFNSKIKNILNNKQFQKNKTYGKSSKTTHENYTGLAPNLSAVFITYFMDDFEKVTLPNVYKQIKAETPVPEIEDMVNKAIEESVYNASKRMAQIAQENDNGQGWGNQWKPIFDMLDHNDKATKMLSETVKNAIGANLFESLQIELQNQRQNKTRLSKGMIQEVTKSSLGNVRGRTASIGGSVLEPVIALFANYFNGHAPNANGGLGYQMEAINFGGNKMVTDVMMLFSTNMELDLERLELELFNAMSSGSSDTIREVYRKIEEFNANQELQGALDELYQVYVNAKNYQLGADGRNYTKAYEGQLEELPEFLRANGVSIDSTWNFLRFAYNTAAGAIREGERFALEEQTCNALKAVAANIMFDDYTEIGHGNTHSIHMYYLSGKYIPASEVLTAMANAVADAKSMSKATVTLPGPIKDLYKEDAPPDYGYGGNTNADIKQNIYRHWEEESQEAKLASHWSVSFTLRIKDLLGGVI